MKHTTLAKGLALVGLAAFAAPSMAQDEESMRLACSDSAGRDMSCELNSALNASIRIGLEYEDGETVDGDFEVRNFGSRLRWGGETELDNGLTGIGYIEFGVNPDNNDRNDGDNTSGVDRTRQLWIGLEGGFGAAKIGAQYTAFYDIINSYTDIAWWGSCWTEPECARDTRALKYEGTAGGLSYAASFTADPGDDDNDAVDNFELGANYDLGGFTVGLAASIQADDVLTDDDGNVTGDNDGGTLLGAVVAGEFDGGSAALTVRLADEDFDDTDGGDDVTDATLGLTFGNAYLVANVADNGDDSPYYATLGYYTPLDPASLFYYEVQVIDADDGTDETVIGRATYIYNFDAVTIGMM